LDFVADVEFAAGLTECSGISGKYLIAPGETFDPPDETFDPVTSCLNRSLTFPAAVPARCRLLNVRPEHPRNESVFHVGGIRVESRQRRVPAGRIPTRPPR